MRKSVTWFVLFIFTGAFVGTIAGYFIGTFLAKGALYDVVSKGIVIGFNPFQMDLFVLSFTMGLHLRINLFTIIGVLLVLWWHRR